MTDFKAKMHQNCCLLGIRPRPRCRSNTALPKGVTSNRRVSVGEGREEREEMSGFSLTLPVSPMYELEPGAVLAKHTIDQIGLLLILDLVLRMNHKVP